MTLLSHEDTISFIFLVFQYGSLKGKLALFHPVCS